MNLRNNLINYNNNLYYNNNYLVSLNFKEINNYNK